MPRVDLAEESRRLPELRQGVEHPSGAEDAAVAGRRRRRDHDEIDDPPCRRDADPLEHHDERALLGVELVPGDERHDDDQGADVEDQDPPYHGVDRAREHLLGILGLARGDADQLDAQEGERHDLQAEDHPHHAHGNETAVRPQVGEACRLTQLAETEQDDDEADGDQAR